RIKLQLIAPFRGLLLDRNGAPLTENKKNFRLFLDTESGKIGIKSMKSLSHLLDISDEKIAQLVQQAKVSRHAPPVLIKEFLSRDELAQFEFYHLNYPGIFIDV